MSSKLILLWPLSLFVITVALSIVLYFFQDDSIAYNAPWAITAYVGSILSGVTLGIIWYLAFKSSKPIIKDVVIDDIVSPVNDMIPAVNDTIRDDMFIAPR